MRRVSAPLYNNDILRLAVATASHPRLADPSASAERRSQVCGSTITVDVRTGDDGRVSELGMSVRACALGQASASVMAGAATGKSGNELRAASDALAAWLAGEGAMPDWPGIDVLVPALPHSARHGSIRLPFEALADAVRQAQADAAAGN